MGPGSQQVARHAPGGGPTLPESFGGAAVDRRPAVGRQLRRETVGQVVVGEAEAAAGDRLDDPHLEGHVEHAIARRIVQARGGPELEEVEARSAERHRGERAGDLRRDGCRSVVVTRDVPAVGRQLHEARQAEAARRVGRHDADGHRHREAGDVADELDRVRVGELQVVEQQQRGASVRGPREQLADGEEHALSRRRELAAQGPLEFDANPVRQLVEQVALPTDDLVDGVHDAAEEPHAVPGGAAAPDEHVVLVGLPVDPLEHDDAGAPVRRLDLPGAAAPRRQDCHDALRRRSRLRVRRGG